MPFTLLAEIVTMQGTLRRYFLTIAYVVVIRVIFFSTIVIDDRIGGWGMTRETTSHESHSYNHI